jgi:hypothetical protein
VGESYGAVPDGPSQRSVVVLQNELASQRSQSGALPRVIWLPEGTSSEQAQQQAFIEALHQDAEAQFGADLITGDLEDLKTSVHATLKKLEKPEPDQPAEQAAAADGTRPRRKKGRFVLIGKPNDQFAPVNNFLNVRRILTGLF